MKNNLTKIFRIQRFLSDINYPDQYRIAREISNFLGTQKKISENDIFQRLHKQEPWEYIQGYVNFCNINFKVTKDTLIPRIETEQLVYECKNIIEKEHIVNIIEVGTGSGCITLSLRYLLKHPSLYSYYATEISKDALEVARWNEKKIFKEKSIHWIKTNLIEKLPDLKGSSILIANLPYIPTNMYKKLDQSVIGYEPRIALDGGEDGLKFYRELFRDVSSKNLGIQTMYFETETSIFEQSKKLVKEFFPNSKIKGVRDCYGRKRFLKINLLPLK